MTRQIIEEGEKLAEQWEALRLFAYPDPAQALAKATRGQPWGFKPAREILATLPPTIQLLRADPWTCGYGHTGADVTADTQCDAPGALAWLRDDLRGAEDTVERLVKAPLNDHQFAALVLFVFNIGETNFANSTLLRELNKLNYASVATEIMKWDHALEDGVMVEEPGLKVRRGKERDLWGEPDSTVETAFAAASTYPMASAGTPVAPPLPAPASQSKVIVGSSVTLLGIVGNWIAKGWDWITQQDLDGYHDLAQHAADNLKPLVDYSTIFKNVFLICSALGVGLIMLDELAKRKAKTGVIKGVV